MILKTELGSFSTYKDLYLEMERTGTRVVTCTVEYWLVDILTSKLTIEAVEILKNHENGTDPLPMELVKKIASM